MLSRLFLLFTLYPSILLAGDMPLVISEIQKSMEKSFGVSFPDQSPMPPVDEKKEAIKEPVKREIEKKEIVKKKLVEVKEKKKASKSPGQIKMEEQLAKNREILKKRREEFLNKRKGIVSNKKASNKIADDKSSIDGDWMTQRKSSVESWGEQKKKQQKKWQVDRLATIKRWENARKAFKKILPEIKSDLTEIPFGSAEAPISTLKPKQQYRAKSTSPVTVARTSNSPLELSFIEEAFRIPVRSQGRRPTCAAFAAVRAVEILAKGLGQEKDLSEQYFYFASKPDCQQSPCQRPGSWPRQAFDNSKKGIGFDIPLEADCPYNESKKSNNETQIPLKRSCDRGVAKVSQFSMVKNRYEIQDRIRSGQPVIGGFKLSDDFFLNTGFVFKEANQKMGKGMHAQGHAILLVGVMELPKGLQKTQGRYCTLIANSWGEGWGRGGHACISDAWFDQYRYEIPFIALEKVAIQ
ncbi:MAG: C1 family peptidase [Bacteriovoracaceae bacterium]|nr:C1 family peptidase [Bacteriovoracaceae bacterium]